MDTVTYPDDRVRAAATAWIRQRIDVSVSAEVARAFGVAAVPAALAVDGEGRILARREGFLEPAAFVSWLADARAEFVR